VRDNGKGLPEGFDPDDSEGLGLQIVRTLVASELGGSLTMGAPEGQPGTEVVLTIPRAGLPRR
jgi:two-component sensor histidine kinase